MIDPRTPVLAGARAVRAALPARGSGESDRAVHAGQGRAAGDDAGGKLLGAGADTVATVSIVSWPLSRPGRARCPGGSASNPRDTRGQTTAATARNCSLNEFGAHHAANAIVSLVGGAERFTLARWAAGEPRIDHVGNRRRRTRVQLSDRRPTTRSPTSCETAHQLVAPRTSTRCSRPRCAPSRPHRRRTPRRSVPFGPTSPR